MKMKKMHFKKFMSVFMACIMLLSCWVWIAPEHAHAATAGTYDVKVRVKTTNSVDVGDNKNLTLTLDYKTNNGSGSAGTPLTHDVSYTWAENDNADNSYTFEDVNGYPTKLNIDVLFATTVAVARQWDCTIYISIYNEDTGAWDLVQETSLSKKGGGWGQSDMDFTVDSIGGTPTATKIKFLSGDESLTIPKVGETAVTKTYTAGVYDQYGVRMTHEPTYYVRSTAPTSAQTSSSSITGVSMSSGTSSGTMTVTSDALNTSADTKNVYVHAKYNTVYANKTVALNDPSYTFKYNKNTTDSSASISPSVDTSGKYYNTFGSAAINGTRTGFTFKGFYQDPFEDSYEDVKYSGTPLSSSTRYTADLTWYAAWQANKHKLVFNYKDENYADQSYVIDEYYGRNYELPSAPEYAYVKDGDVINKTYHFEGWQIGSTIVVPPTTIPNEDITYTAKYTETIHYADKTALQEQIRLANEKKEEQEYKDEAYTAESMAAFENALTAAKTALDAKLLLSMQETVDTATENLKSARENLVPKKFIVIFVDEDGTILKDGYHFVDYGASVEIPANPVQDPDANYHYTFKEWDTTNSDGLNACNKVITDLRYIAKFDAVPHDFTETVTSSTCTSDGVITKTCDCGYSYTVVNPDDLAGHTWSTDYKVIAPATCATKGSEAKYCTACGAIDESTTREIPALGHAWGEYSEYTPATCFGEGTEVSICSLCNGRNVRKTAKLTHSFGPATVVPKTCTTDGYTKEVCSVCGFTNFRDYDIAKGHTLKYETVPETCVSSGYTKTYCENCDFEKTTIYPATGWHEYPTTWETVSEATCVGHGVEKRVCTVCNSATETRLTDIVDHTYPTEWTTEIHATCKGDGYQTKTCTYCGNVISQKVPALEHNYETTKDTQPTCILAGEKVETCSLCGNTKTTVTQPNGHSYDEGVHSDASCTKVGFTTYTCSCGHSYIEFDDGAETTGHNFTGTETVTKEATCTEDGYKTVQCINEGCEAKTTVVIPKTGHNHVAGEAIESTCTTSGYTPYTCSCGDTYNVYNEKDPAKGHEFSELVSEKDATCTTDGEEVYKCSRCEATQTTVLPKLGHNYVLESSAEATCTTPATETYKCSVCADTYTEYIAPANGHAWGTWTKVQDATADKFGIEKRICTVCQAEEFRTTEPIGDHAFSEEVTVQPGCETEGKKVYTCIKHENCSANYEDTLPATGHKAELVYEAPTCTKEGSTQIVCETCSKELSEAQTIPVTAHAYGEGKQTTAPTCTEDGTMSYTCTACGHTRTEVIAKTGHNLSSVYSPASCEGTGSVVTSCSKCNYTTSEVIPATGHKLTVTVNKATCTTEGSVVEECTACNYTKTTTLEPLEHSFTGDEVVIKDATCTENGEKTVKCSRCDETTTVIIPKLGHAWPTDWTVTENATCTEDGEETKTCANCGETITAVIPKKGHNWSEWVKVDATNDTDGSWTRTCSNCNEKETVVIPKGGHIWDKGTVTEEPTCKNTGTMVYKCTAHENCGVTLEITLGVVQHVVETEKKDATCKEGGYVKVYCSECETEFKTETTEKAAHTYTAGTPVDATCTTSGYTPYTCSCGDTYKAYNENDPATGHKLVEGASNATCTAGGVMTLNCSDCTYSTTVEVPALGHNYVEDETAATNATCAAAATKTYKCSHADCEASYTISVGEKTTEHTWGGWTVQKSATTDSIGLRTRNCTVCGQLDYEIIPATGSHVFNVKIEDQSKDATCVEAGLEVYGCSAHENCTETSKIDLPATGHKPELQYTPATCTQAGKTEMVCTVEGCGEVLDTENISALGHAWGNERVTPANCSDNGKIEYMCSRCTATHETIIKNDFVSHDYVTTIIPATCAKEGSIVVKCSRCISNPVNEVIAKLEHTWDDGVIKDGDNATCTEDGTKIYTCTADDCGATKTEIIPKTGHTWGNWEVTTPSTNGAEGEMTRICENGCKETVKIPAGGHNLVGTVTTPASCTQEGLLTYDCTAHTGDNDCGITITVTLDKLQHEITTSTETAATCEEDGKVVTKCENCNTATTITVIPATGHNYSGVATKEATCTEEGVMTYTCAHDSAHQYTTKIAKLQHNYVAGDPVPATCTDSGYTPYNCATCDSNYVIITESAKGHNYKEGVSTATCIEGGEMTLACDCGVTMKADVPALGHDYVINSELSTGATCKDTATETYECSRCEAAYTVSVGSKTENHTYIDNWTIVKDATESSIGYKTRECTVCGKLEVATIDATGEHSFTNGEIVESKAATCLVNGYEIRKCANHADCGKQTTITIPATGHTEELYYTDATCAQAGSAIMSCKTCGAELKKEEIAKLDHSWANETIALSDCTNAGKVVFTCSYSGCNETKTVNLPVNENAHKLTVTVTDATCEEDGSVVTKCELCGKEDIKTIAKKGHTWKDTPAASTDATCEAEGSATYDCVNCDKQNTVVIPALGHIYIEGDKVAPTCTTSGYTVYVCEHDENHTYNVYDATKPANGHDWSDWTVTTPATEEADGLKTRTCACGEKEEEVIPAMQHSMVEDTAAYVAPSCTAEGQRVYKCTTNHNGVNCTYALTVTLPKIAHSLKTEVTDATCEETGLVVTSCEKCKEVNIETEIPALGHSFTSTETVTIPATCDVDGEKTVKCSRCDEATTVVIPKLGHDYELTGTTQASCDAPATETYECSRCDSSYVKITAPASGHQYLQVEGSSTATCTEAGEITLKCSACGDEIKTAVPALGHDYELIGTTDATCEAPATETYKCSRCEAAYERTVGETTDHSWSEWKITVEATEGSLGYKERECTVCHKTEVEIIPAIGNHSFTIEIARENVTCETDGYVTYDCAVHTGENDCGLTSTVKAPATGHNEVTTVTDATCTEDGLSVTKCINEGCGKVIREEIIPTTGHDWDEGTVITEATCSSTGVMKYTCKNDSSHTYTQIIPSTGHAWDEGVETTQPTCTTAGVRTYTCLTDKTHTYIQLIPVKGHSYGEWIIDEDATCTEDGSKHRVCENDDTHVENAVIPATGHDMGEWVVETAATCTEDGKEISRCANCEHYLEKTVAAKGHLWSEWKITEGDCLTGYTLGRTCVTCAETQSKDVESNGHTYPTDENGNIIYDSVLSPTCTNEGMYYYDCEVCGGGDVLITAKTPGFEEELAAKGHKWIISEETDEEGWIITSEATCFKDGMKYRVCENGCGTNCGLDFESKETVIIPAEHLNWVKQGGKDATCTEEGYTEYYLCMDCGYITGRNKIAATGHTDADNNSKCDTCDTAISSGSSGEIVDCNCLCHETGGFKAFFFKIINFFWRLFRIRPVCDCGKAHY